MDGFDGMVEGQAASACRLRSCRAAVPLVTRSSRCFLPARVGIRCRGERVPVRWSASRSLRNVPGVAWTSKSATGSAILGAASPRTDRRGGGPDGGWDPAVACVRVPNGAGARGGGRTGACVGRAGRWLHDCPTCGTACRTPSSAAAQDEALNGGGCSEAYASHARPARTRRRCVS